MESTNLAFSCRGLRAKLSKLGYNFQIMSFPIKPGDSLSIFEEDHCRRLCIGVPEFGQFRVILLFDADQSGAILQQRLGSEDVVFDFSFRVGVVEVNQYGLFFREEGQDFVHCLVLGLQSTAAGCVVSTRHKGGLVIVVVRDKGIGAQQGDQRN